MQTQCKDEESFRLQEIYNAKVAFNNSLKANNLCQTSLKDATANLPLLQASQVRYNATLTKAEAQRKKDHHDYEVLMGELKDLIKFLNDFLKQIDSSIKANSKFTSLFELGATLLKKANKLGKISIVMPIFLQMAEDDSTFRLGNGILELEETGTNVGGKKASVQSANTSSSLSSSSAATSNPPYYIPYFTNSTKTSMSATSSNNSIASNKTVPMNQSNYTNYTVPKKSNTTVSANSQILDKLRKNVFNLVIQVTADLNKADLDENQANLAFMKLRQYLMGIMDLLGKNIIKTKAQITLMNTCMGIENKIMQSAASKQVRNGKLLDSAAQTCKDFLAEFISATESRQKEVKAINDILFIIKKRFGEIKNLNDIVNKLLKSLSPNNNKTLFAAYKENQKIKIKDNLHGKQLSEGK